jgi:hypothetical protein
LDLENRQADGQGKAPGAGTAGVEIEDVVLVLHVGGMGVAEDDRGQARGRGVQVQGVEIVQDVEEQFSFLSRPAVVCACCLGFSSGSPLSGGAGLGSLSSIAVQYSGYDG